MKLFIGDLSKEDAEVLEYYGNGKRVLEFGCGGSTQIFAQVSKFIKSVDTSYGWIWETRDVIIEIGNGYVSTNTLEYFYILLERGMFSVDFDVIYIDGEWDKRLDFAKDTWHLLKEDGIMLFHDTRREKDQNNVDGFLKHIDYKCESIEWNVNKSNITVVTKGEGYLQDITFKDLPYVNWNKEENKEDWMANAMLPRPKNWKELLIEKLGINDTKRKSEGVSR